MKFLFKLAVIIIAIFLIVNIVIPSFETGNINFNPMDIINNVLPQSFLLINHWTDANNMSGYDFYEDGSVTITYANFNIPIVNIPFNGIIEGTYTTEKINKVNYITLNYTLFNQQIIKQYRYSISNDTLILVDPESGTSWTYFTVSSLNELNSTTTN